MSSDNPVGIDDNEINQMVASAGSSAPVPAINMPDRQTVGYQNPAPATEQLQPAVVQQPAPQVTLTHQPSEPVTIVPSNAAVIPPTPPSPAPIAPAPVKSPEPPAVKDHASTDSSGFKDLKQDALNELRPLAEKLDLPPEEKFDALLLIIRSTDDSSMLPALYAAAHAIPDETRRATALLDVIKEIDYFGQSKSPIDA